MRKFTLIPTSVRRENLYDTFTKPIHNKVIDEPGCFEPDMIFLSRILMGCELVSLKSVENKDGTILLANNDSLIKFFTLKSFFKNELDIDGLYFDDLSGLERSLFEGIQIKILCLRVPFSTDSFDIFVEE